MLMQCSSDSQKANNFFDFFFKRLTFTLKSLQIKNLYPFITSTNDLEETMLMLGVVVTKRCFINQVCMKSSLEQYYRTLSHDCCMSPAC